MVEWKKIGEVLTVHTGKQLNRSGLSEVGKYPVINGGRTPSGYTDSYNENKNSITISQGGESAGFVNWVDTAFWAGAHCYVVENTTNQNLRFLFHLLKNYEYGIMESKQGAGIPGLNRKNLYSILIPIPSLEEQKRIVGILDTFTDSIENLKQQIAQRRKQYEHYRDQLLDLEGKEGVEMIPLKDVADIGTGSSNTNEGLEKGKYPFYTRGKEVLRKNEYEFDETSIITAGDGVGVGKVFHFVSGKYALHQRAYRIHIKSEYINPRFIYYYMVSTFETYIKMKSFFAAVTSVRKPMIFNYPIPKCSLIMQQRIVSILDTFEASISNLEAQLAQRQKQYEYYRNQLLTFE